LAILIRLIPSFQRKRETMAGSWHRGLLKVLGLHVTVHGRPADGPRIIVANHVSWLDVPALGSFEPTRFVSKAEVRSWPLAGFLATTVGTFYLKRGAGGTKTLTQELVACINGGGHCTFFPEGTTTSGESTLRFQPRLFAVAIETRQPIQPVAFRYGLTRDGRNIAPFIGDDDMVSHLLRVMREPSLEVEITYLPPIASTDMDRASLAQATQAAVMSVIAPGQQVTAASAAGSEDTLAA
jgi:1-acyl-sn-glycerol-3-phosphate acyltransferase